MPKTRIFHALLIGFIFLNGCFSCSNPANTTQNPSYFKWKEFLQTEINRLQQQPFAIQKTIILDQKKEVKTLNEVNLENELSMFLEADLNKPAFKNSYDDLSENNLIWYSLKKGENLKTKKMLIQVDQMDLPENVEIVIQESNFLFSTQKKLNMHFSGGKLKSYSIDGTQQLAWLKPTSYKMLGVVLYK